MEKFGRSQRTIFKPSVYQPGKRARRMPRWLVILLMGITLGTGGLLFLQANYGPPRLTLEQSKQLHSELSAANLERQRQHSQLEEAAQQHAAQQSNHEKLVAELAQARLNINNLKQELLLFQDVIPPDPRGGAIGIRSALFKREPGQLGFHVLLTRKENQAAPFKGTLTLTINGSYPNGRGTTLTPEGVSVNIDRYDHAKGLLQTPDGFTPRMVTLRVIDKEQKMQAMRVYYVRN